MVQDLGKGSSRTQGLLDSAMSSAPLLSSAVFFLSQYLGETGRDGFHSLISHPYKHLRHPDEKGPGMEPWQTPYWKEQSLLSWLWKDEVTMSSALPELSRRQVLLKRVLKCGLV